MEGARKRERATGKEYLKAQTNTDFSFASLEVKEDYISPFSLAAYILRKLWVRMFERDTSIHFCCGWQVHTLSWEKRISRTQNMESQDTWVLSTHKTYFPLAPLTEMYFFIFRISVLQKRKNFIWYFKDHNINYFFFSICNWFPGIKFYFRKWLWLLRVTVFSRSFRTRSFIKVAAQSNTLIQSWATLIQSLHSRPISVTLFYYNTTT